MQGKSEGRSERRLRYQAGHRKAKNLSLKQSNSQTAKQSNSLTKPDQVKTSDYGNTKFFADAPVLVKPAKNRARNPFSVFLLPQVLLLLTAAREIMAGSTTTVCFIQDEMNFAVTGEGLKWGWSPWGATALGWLNGNDGKLCNAIITDCTKPVENTTAIANISTLTEPDWKAALYFNPFNKGRAHIYGGNETMTDGISCLVETADWQHDHRPLTMFMYYLVISVVGISTCCGAKYCGNPIKSCKETRSIYFGNNDPATVSVSQKSYGTNDRSRNSKDIEAFIRGDDDYLSLN